MPRRLMPILLPILLILPELALAQALPAVTSTPTAGGGTQWSLSIQTLLLLTSLTFLPAMLLMMTSFTRIIIVLSLLRHALGTQTSPPNQVIVGLALFLTFFIMAPVTERIYNDAYLPLSENKISFQRERHVIHTSIYNLVSAFCFFYGYFKRIRIGFKPCNTQFGFCLANSLQIHAGVTSYFQI